MRIQHNIMSMNAYRNYTNNTSAMQKNLERLSSGYKINRAGDDAAGLAISEKMRAQITGLEVAQKNAKDGISLVQTAEGALTEVHDMLNRMVELATQSANGTYAADTDRTQLQKEVNQLREEINRIADSANFNGIQLLDGSMSGKSQVVGLAMTDSVATKGVYTTGALEATAEIISTDDPSLSVDDIGKTIDYTVTWKDGNGVERTTTVSLTFQGDGTGAVDTTTVGNNYFTDAAGAKYNTAGGVLAAAQLQSAIQNGLSQNDEFKAAFDIATSGTGFQFTAREAGSAGGQILSIGISTTTGLTRAQLLDDPTTTGADSISITTANAPVDSMQKFNISSITVGRSTDKQDALEAKIFEIDGHKFLVGFELTSEQIKALDDDVTYISASAATLTADDTKMIAAEISRVTGYETKAYDPAAAIPGTGTGILTSDIVFTKDRLKLSGTELRLQIGDTSASYNQLNVKIQDMHTFALGIDKISILDQDSAGDSIDVIKNAINMVSDVRGTLGATQNRLDHTINNLSVMTENIQDAESTIRDTDIADEMMAYTKNNILIQSAQAMLAQANQIPQGVLQLLQ